MLDPNSPDSDGDGIGDFLAAVTHVYQNPFDDGEPISGASHGTGGSSGPGGVLDHEMRFVMSIREDADGTQAMWMNLLFRFAGSEIPNIQYLDIWMDMLGTHFSLAPFVLTNPSELVFQDHGADGLCLRFSVRLGPSDQLMVFSPSTYGATVMIDGRIVRSGVTLLELVDDTIVALTPVSPSSFTLVRLDDEDDPFWNNNRVCQINLSIVSSTTAGHVCTVSSARCRPSGELRCPPSCTISIGQTIFVPDGLSTINGGG